MAEIISFSTTPQVQQAPFQVEKSQNPITDKGVKHVDLTASAVELKLANALIAQAKSLKRMIDTGVEEQQGIQEQLESLSALQNVLQKLEQAGFSKEDLNKPLDFPMSASEKQRVMAIAMRQAEAQRDSDIKKAWDAESVECEKIQAWEMKKISGFSDAYSRMKSSITPEYKTAGENGNLYYWGYSKKSREWVYVAIKVKGNVWYPSWASDTIKAAYSAKKAALAEAEKKYQAVTNGVTVGALLYGLGVYAKGEALPKNKDELKIAMSKLNNMISSLHTDQSTVSTDINSLNNDREKQISLASDIFTRKAETMKELIASSR